MVSPSTYEMIHRLEAYEQAAMGTFPEVRMRGDLKSVSRAVYMHEADGKPNPRIRPWGTWDQSLKIPQMLLIQSTIFADVLPLDYDDFTAHYGVTPEQFVALCEDGRVIPNLYWDSDLQKTPSESAYAQHEHLKDVFDYERTNCRINGLRRQRVLEIVGYPVDRQISVADGFRHILEPRLLKIPLDILKTCMLAPTLSHSSAAIVLSKNLMYIDIYGHKYDKQVLFGLQSGTLDWPTPRMTEWIEGRAMHLSTPISGCFGGTVNQPQKHYEAMVRATGSHSSSSGNENIVDDQRKAFAEFLEAATSVNFGGRWTISSRSLPLPMEDRRFRSFRSFLQDKSETLEKANDLLKSFKVVAAQQDNTASLTQWIEYLRIYKDIASAAKQSSSVADSLGPAIIGGYAAASAAKKGTEIAVEHLAEVHYALPRRKFVALIGATLGGVVGGIAGAEANLLLHGTYEEASDWVDKDARRIILDDVSTLTGIGHRR
jgi:hypothetical protein